MSGQGDELLVVEGLCKYFPVVRGVLGKTVGQVRAVDDVSFSIRRGETLGLVGESGCGKTTAGRSTLRLIEPTSGNIRFDGTDITQLGAEEMRPFRRRMQIIFQDPFSSLNPRMRVMDIVGEAMERHGVVSGASVERRVRDLLGRVGLPASWVNRYPHEFSGGQRQRIGVARAIALSPDLIVCDEAVSALDVSIQAQVVNLLIDLRSEMNLAYLFIAHDLSVVKHISQRVAVMYLGRIVELSPCRDLFERPAHPYTRALLSAIPIPDPRRSRQRVILHGDVPTPLNPPPGCHFHTRCPVAFDRCREEIPPVTRLEEGRRQVRCFHADGLSGDPEWYDVLESRLRERAQQENPASVAPPVRLGGLPARGRRQGASSNGSSPGPEEERARGVLALCSLVATVVGLVCVSIGYWGLGGVVVGAGYAGLRLAPAPEGGGAASPRRLMMGVVGAYVLGVLVSTQVEPVRKVAAARRGVAILRSHVLDYQRNVGRLPERLSDLRWRTAADFGRAQPRDPWGRAYGYELGGDGSFEVSSVGQDGVESSDDVRSEP